MLVVWYLLSSFCLTHSMLCDCNIEEKGLLLLSISKYFKMARQKKRFVIVVYFTMAPQGDNIVKVSALLRVGHKVSEVAHLVGLAQPSTRSKSTWTIADCCPSNGIPQAVPRMASCKQSSSLNGIPQAFTIHNSLSTTACTSVDIFAIVHALLYRIDGCARHTDKVCDLTHFASHVKKCRNFHSIVSLGSHFEIHNNNKLFSSMSQSQSIGWIKQKPDNNCQTTRIVIKSFVQLFSTYPVVFSLYII